MSTPLSGKNLLRPTGLQCENLQEYLKLRGPETLSKLYQNPPLCLAVFREMPVLAKHYVMRLLFVEQPVPQAVIASWCSKINSDEHFKVVAVLNDLNVWNDASIPGGLPGWILNPIFKKNLKV